MMRPLLEDLRYAARQLRKSPGITALVVLTVALGIGANTAIFSMINGYLRPLPVKAPSQIVVLAAQTKGDETGFRYRFSYPALTDFRRQADCFSGLFAFGVGITGLSADGKVTQFLNSAVTGNLFTVLGLKPSAGRLFLPGEGETSGTGMLVVLGYSHWQKRFGGNPNVVGKQVRMNGRPARIIGVAPEGFHGLYAGVDLDGYLSLNSLTQLDSRDFASFYTDRGLRFLTVLGRLKPGVTVAEAQSSVNVIARRLEEQYPASDKGIAVHVIPEILARPIPLHFLESLIPVIRGFLLMLAALVLLLACMNVANILLVRATVRQREMAIRAALGSGRARLIRQMLTESILLALLGGAAGILLGRWASAAFASSLDLGTDLPVVVDFSFDWRVFTYAATAALLTGILIGIWPALRASRAEANSVLHDGIRSDSSSAGRQRVRGILVVAQVAGSLVLLIVAGLFVRSLQRAQRMDLGFDPGHVLNVRMDPSQIGYERSRTNEFYRDLERRARTLPGVQSVSLAHSVPLGYISDGFTVRAEGRPEIPGEQPPTIGVNGVGPDYFDTLRIPLVRGRVFRESDNETAPPVAIVNQTLAGRLWPNQDPIGKRFRGGRTLWEVVGVARDSKYLVLFEDHLPYVYVPLAQQYYSMRVLEIRTSVAPESLRVQVQREIQALDSEMPIADLQTMNQSLAGGMGFLMFRIGAVQAGAMGILGLILAVIGVYGVVSYGASQRTRELGIRMALGARPSDVRALVLGQGVRLVIAGVVTGLIGAAALTRVATRFVLLVSATDPLTFTVVTLALAAIALWACYLPARRAMRVDPMVALRHE
jgi:predicted permease